MPIDWSNDLVTSGLVILWEVVGLLPLLTWFILREIRRQLPSLMLALSENPDFVKALRQLATKFGMPAGKMTLNNAIGMAANYAIPMLLSRMFGGAPPAQPPAP